MAPSPELGQPKAPDKTLSCSCNNSSIGTNKVMNLNDISSNCSTNEAVSTTCNIPQQIASTSASSNNLIPNTNIEKTSQKLNNLEEYELKELLDEAYSYKNPKDRENKSETFLQLLNNVEREKAEENKFNYRAHAIRFTRPGSNSHNHGGSLQDLVEAAHNDLLLDSDYVCGNRNRRHQNSTQKKFSLVSSRQREGGSLPSNVNVSNWHLANDERLFLNEVKNGRNKSERTCSGTSWTSVTSGTSSTVSTCGHDSLNSACSKDETNFVEGTHTAIDISEIFSDDIQNLTANETYVEENLEPRSRDENVEFTAVKKFPHGTMNATIHAKVEIASYPDNKYWVDEPISFQSLERGKDKESLSLPLKENLSTSKPGIIEKPEITKPTTPTFQSSKTTPNPCDENANSLSLPYSTNQLPTKNKKKKSQSERNMTTLNVKSVAGYRGEDSVDELLKFIENTDSKKTYKNVTNRKKDKKKDRDKDIKKYGEKVKKCNSLEELRSCTNLDEDERDDCAVTLRSKGKKGTVSLNTSCEGKENSKQNQKRSERRSWGTEELTYLGDNSIENSREKIKDKDKFKKLKEITDKTEKFDKIEGKRKKEDNILSNIAIVEPIVIENAEFHVVTKKKRTKRKQALEDNKSSKICVASKESDTSYKKYQTSSNFVNDRDAYINSIKSVKNRRKSTSSVPPSEKSDSSDIDSVHSLPIESITNRHQMGLTNSSHTQQQSYADIARIMNSNKQLALTTPAIDKIDKWPLVSSNNAINHVNSQCGTICHAEGQTNMVLNYTNKNSIKMKSLNRDFPDLLVDKFNVNESNSGSNNNIRTTVIENIKNLQKCSAPHLNNTTKLNDIVKSKENYSRQTFEKSKSLDNDSYCSIDQYPALEKPIKRQIFQNDSKNLLSTSSATSSYFGKPRNAVSCTLASQILAPNCSTILAPSTNSMLNVHSDSKSKLVNNVDMVTILAANPPSNNVNNFNNTNINLSSVKKSKNLNAKVKENSIMNVYFQAANELSNVRSKNDLITQDTSVASFVNQINLNTKKTKLEAILYPANINTNTKKVKKDKQLYNMNKTQDGILNDEHIHSLPLPKNSNRPAVIILNDDFGDKTLINNEFTFGDFNQEELRMLGNSNHLDNSGQFTTVIHNSSVSFDEIHRSPHSDLGYSSSHNQSILSDSIDNSLGKILPAKMLIMSDNSELLPGPSSINNDNITILETKVSNADTLKRTPTSNSSVKMNINTLNNNKNPYNKIVTNQKVNVCSDVTLVINKENLDDQINNNQNSNIAANRKTIFQNKIDAVIVSPEESSDICERFIAPQIAPSCNTINYERMVDFVGLAWDDIIQGINGEIEYYKGQ